MMIYILLIVCQQERAPPVSRVFGNGVTITHAGGTALWGECWLCVQVYEVDGLMHGMLCVLC